ncbi:MULTISPECIES: response regulator transcription factor [unclassified Streptomyces]|uniref:response regulator transcription factor n=1 Tax=Streptomyces TaxID=1883 RepID=UPI00202DD437|nr:MULTISPECIES: response regulator transcription factor [unclassified Streptomyces]MCM1977127.1 response regulator transcription factor [Streptomyces sp. G1]MCX5127135.1 response regulator transcription factor [Streptomyces sp. NBC_00347]MCX5295432.1 response regulator transcription factor [Streptomyces sp. NBC_00193]
MRLLLVEDDDHVAAALSAILARHGFKVTHARSGEEALQALLSAGAPPQASPYGVILLDLGLPDQDGYEVCGKIRKRTSTPVIMVTARADVRSRIHGLNMGADDYVTKPYDTGELLARIHAVARRTGASEETTAVGTAGTPGVVRLGTVGIELSTRRVSVDGVDVALTRKEFDLLALLAQRPGVVFRREQIISEVWRTSWEGTGRTLEVHVASLRSKLRMPALIETVRGVGYRLVVPPAPAAPAPPAASAPPAV